jgi:hypothetical protein
MIVFLHFFVNVHSLDRVLPPFLAEETNSATTTIDQDSSDFGPSIER